MHVQLPKQDIKVMAQSTFKITQYFKFMVEALEYVVYSNTVPSTSVFWAKSVDAAHAHLIPCAKYSTLIKGG